MKTKPHRIQLSRKKGFNLQAISLKLNGLPAVNCARPSLWGNIFIIGENGDAKNCVELYAEWLDGLWAELEFVRLMEVLKRLHTLKNKNLACYCKTSEHCHCDILLKAAARV